METIIKKSDGLEATKFDGVSLNDSSLESASKKHRWISPQLKEFGNLSFVVKGISYNPADGTTNLTP